MKNDLKICLFPTTSIDRRAIEDVMYVSFNSVQELRDTFPNIDIHVHDPLSFMEACNDQEYDNMDEYWVLCTEIPGKEF